jgi:hypothetical protein
MIPGGMPVQTSPYLKWTEYIQAKTHKRKRINKKWLKRYGYKSVDRYKAMFVHGTLWVHPDVFEKMKQQTP